MIAILSALAEEQAGLVERMTRVECVEHAGRTFWLGLLDGQLEVVLTLSRIGKVAAALTATALIAKWGVQRMVFTGVAGGTGPGVAGGRCGGRQPLFAARYGRLPAVPRYEIPLTGQSLFPADPLLLEAACAAVREVQPDLRGGRYRADLHCGLIASGDRFVSASSEVHALLADAAASGFHPLAVEMEGAAVAQVCADYQRAFRGDSHYFGPCG